VHSHLVPGVDDGARSIEHTVEGVERMVAVGIDRIVTTPHLDASLTRDRARFAERMTAMDRAWEEASSAVAERWPEVGFRRGFEIKMDVPEPDLDDARLRLGGTRFILVEWARMQVPPASADALERLGSAGMRPIVAHPERYHNVDRELAIVGVWRDAGALLQVNHGSLVGRYGPKVAERALRLLQRGWVDYLSTDFHARPHLDLHLRAAEARLGKLGASEQFDRLAGTNPRRLFDDEDPLPVPPITLETGLLGRVRRMFGPEE